MKKLSILLLASFLFALPARAADFVSVTPTIIKGMATSWEYKYSFKSSPKAQSALVYGHQDACDRPMRHDPATGKLSNLPLLPQPIICFKTEAEARVQAQKDADTFEKQCRTNPECDTDKIVAKHRKQKVGTK
jgi:hypothetical protein